MPVDTTKTDFVRNLFNDAITSYGRVKLADIDKQKRQRIGEIINENMMSALNPKTVTATTPDLTRPENFVGPGDLTPSGQEAFGTNTNTYTIPPSANDVFSGYARTKAALDKESLPSSDLDQMVGVYSKLQPKQTPYRPASHVAPGSMVLNPSTGRYEQVGTKPVSTADQSLELRKEGLAVRKQQIAEGNAHREKADATAARTKVQTRINKLHDENQQLGHKMTINSLNATKDAAKYNDGTAERKQVYDDATATNANIKQQIADNEKELEALNAQIGGTFKAGQQPTPAASNQPKVGDIKYGFKFKGGDPSKQENWVKQ